MTESTKQAQQPQQLTGERVVALLSRPAPLVKPRKPGSKKCSCGKVISANARACRDCNLINLDAAILNMDTEATKRAGSGDFAEANRFNKAEKELRNFRQDVQRGLRKTL